MYRRHVIVPVLNIRSQNLCTGKMKRADTYQPSSIQFVTRFCLPFKRCCDWFQNSTTGLKRHKKETLHKFTKCLRQSIYSLKGNDEYTATFCRKVVICLLMAGGSTTVRTMTAGKHYLMVLHYTPYSLSCTNNHTQAYIRVTRFS